MSESSFPKISVVMPNYNQAKTLAQAIESICDQDPPPYEVVVLDDCSTDGSMEIIEACSRKYPFFRCIRYPEKSTNWIKSLFEHLHLLTGDYILSLAGDDLVYPGFLRAATDALNRFPHAGVVFNNYQHATYDLQVFAYRMHGFSDVCFVQGESLHRQLCRPWIVEGGVSPLLRRDALLWLIEHMSYELGTWFDSMGYAVLALKYGALYLPGVYGCVRVHGNAYSTQSSRDESEAMQQFEAVRRFLCTPEFRSFLPPVVAASLEKKCIINSHPSVARRYSAAPLLGEATRLLNEQRLPEACRAFQEVAQSYPGAPEVYEPLALAHVMQGQYAEGEKAFRQALLLQPHQAGLHSNLAVCLLRQGRPLEALWCCYQAIHLNPSSADAHSNLAACCMSLGRFQEAVQACQRALQIAPQHAQASAQLQQLQAAVSQAQ